MNRLISGETTVQFAALPIRPGGETTALFQPAGFDSAGDEYVYDKSVLCRTRRELEYSHESAAIRDALIAFLGSVNGSRDLFTWEDETATAHTVRYIAGTFDCQQTGADRFRLAFSLEIDSPLEIPAVPGGFALTRNAKTGIAPVWILRLTVNAVDYFLSDSAFTVAATSASPDWPANTSVTTRALVRSWGEVQELVNGDLNEIRVASFTADCINDPLDAGNLHYLAKTYELEQNPVELYQWFIGLNPATDPPRLRFKGYINNIALPDETSLAISIDDESTRLQDYLGRKITLSHSPNADPDDIGKIVPIPYGSFSKAPALAIDAGKVTSLTNTVSNSQTTWQVGDVSGLAVNTVLQADLEQVRITAINGLVLTVERAYNTTIAAAHNRGTIAWEYKTSFVYLFSDVPLATMPRIYATLGPAILDITAVASRYLGAGSSALVGSGVLGGQHPSYPGKAVVTIPGYITASQAVDLLVADGINVNDALDVLDNIEVNDMTTIRDLLRISDTTDVNDTTDVIDDISAADSGHAHVGSQTTLTQYGSPTSYDGTAVSSVILYASFPALGTQVQSTYTITVNVGAVNGLYWPNVYIDGVYMGQVSGATRTWTSTSGNTPVITINAVGGSNILRASITTARREYTYIPTTANGVAAINTTGSASKIGSVSKLGLVDRIGSIDRLGSVSSSGSAFRLGGVSKSGTVTISGNSVANTLVGDGLLVDGSRAITTPQAVFSDLLASYCNDTTLQVIGTFPASYTFNGLITEYKRKIDWLDELAFQCRAYYRRIRGKSYLIYCPDNLTSIKIISAVRVQNGQKSHSMAKVPTAQIINKINLLYNRDWRQSKSDAAYTGVSSSSDATSISNYGTLERPELFMFDFVTSSTMADSLCAFYLAKYATRCWRHSFETFLDHSELSFADAVTLGFADNAVGEIIEAGIAPGNQNEIDTVRFTVEVR